MSEERLARLEDMMGQLIGMVGKVLSEQHEVRKDMAEMKQEISGLKQEVGGLKQEMVQANVRLDKLEAGQTRFNDSILYLMDKSTQHDHDIHVLKRHILK